MNAHLPHLPSNQSNRLKAELSPAGAVRRAELNAVPPPQSLEVPSQEFKTLESEADPGVRIFVTEVEVTERGVLMDALDALVEVNTIVVSAKGLVVIQLGTEVGPGLCGQILGLSEGSGQHYVRNIVGHGRVHGAIQVKDVGALHPTSSSEVGIIHEGSPHREIDVTAVLEVRTDPGVLVCIAGVLPYPRVDLHEVFLVVRHRQPTIGLQGVRGIVQSPPQTKQVGVVDRYVERTCTHLTVLILSLPGAVHHGPPLKRVRKVQIAGETVLVHGRQGVQDHPVLLVNDVDGGAADEPAWTFALPVHGVRKAAFPCDGKVDMPGEAVLVQRRRGVQQRLGRGT